MSREHCLPLLFQLGLGLQCFWLWRICWQGPVLPHTQDPPCLCPSCCSEKVSNGFVVFKKKVQVEGYKSQRLARGKRGDRAPEQAVTPAPSTALFPVTTGIQRQLPTLARESLLQQFPHCLRCSFPPFLISKASG